MSQNQLLINSLKEVFNNFLADVKSQQIQGDGLWTKELKERLGELGMSATWNCNVATGGFLKYFEAEWLFDMTWYKENEKGQLSELVMVLESEWTKSYAAIKYDFEKLLISKCPLKVMICQWPKADIQNLFDKIESSINAFGSSTDETYLLVVLDSSTDNEFIFETFGFNK
jgi:hypothetical protein